MEVELKDREMMEAELSGSDRPAQVSPREGQTMIGVLACQSCPAAGPYWAHLAHHLPPRAPQ